MSSPSRAPIRKAFAALLETALVGVGLPAQAVYDYQVGDFRDAGVVVVVSSGPVRRQRRTLDNCWHTTARLYVYSFVRYADPGAAWTEENAEDALDAVEAIIAETVLQNAYSPGLWNFATYAEATEPTGRQIGGLEYRMEIILVDMEVL